MSTVSLPFFGGELTSFSASNGNVSETSSTGFYNATYSRCALTVYGYYALASSPLWSSAATFWFHGLHCVTYDYPSSPSGPVVMLYNGSTVVAQLFAVTGISTYTLQLQTLQSGSMTNVGSAQTFNTSPPGTSAFYLATLDVQVVGGASGSAVFYVNGSAVASATGLNHTAWAGVTQIVLGATQDTFINHASTFYWSQIICDITSTVGRFLITDSFTNESATNTGWSGFGGASKVADINEVPLDDTTYLQAATTGLTETFYQSGLNLSGYYVLGRGVAVRARQQDSGPAHIQLATRSASTNYTSPQFTLTPGFQPFTYMWTKDPATSGTWTPTSAAAAELGVQSQT